METTKGTVTKIQSHQKRTEPLTSEVRLGPWPHWMDAASDRGGLRGGAQSPLLTNREAAIERAIVCSRHTLLFVVGIHSTL